MAARPVPRPGVLDIEAYVPGKSAAPGGVKLHKLSSNETPLGPEPEGDRGLRRGCRQARTLSGRLGDQAARGDRRQATASTRPASSAAPARTNCCSCSPSAYLGARRRGRLHRARLSRLPHRHPGRRRQARRRRRRRTSRADVDAILAAVTPRTQDRLPRQPQQPDRHLSALRRGQAPACRPAAARAARPRRRLCRICPPQRLRGGPRTGRDAPTTS